MPLAQAAYWRKRRMQKVTTETFTKSLLDPLNSSERPWRRIEL